MAMVISNFGNRQFEWSFVENGSISLDGTTIQADIQKISPGRFSLLLNGKSFHTIITRNDFIYTVLINGRSYKIGIETSISKESGFSAHTMQKNHSNIEVRSPMPGMVVRCEVSEGTIVAAGDGLLILEAMKMENEIRAARNGTVKKILVHDRQIVDKGELLLIIE
jgi:acetyl/propionyl-CoA carboxylase alpha subunit